MALNTILTSPYKSMIEDLILGEVPFHNIVELMAKHNVTLDIDEIEAYCKNYFDADGQKVYRQAVKRQKVRESDERFLEGQQSIQNSISTLNHLLEQTTLRWKLIMDKRDEDRSDIKEKDIIAYMKEIRETAKVVHEINKELKDDSFIPINVFYEEVERVISMVINFLVHMDRTVPGHDFKGKFLVEARDAFEDMQNTISPGKATHKLEGQTTTYEED